MKKTLSVVLAVIMMFAMCVPAIAGEKVDALDGQQKAIAQTVLQAWDSFSEEDKQSQNTYLGKFPTYVGEHLSENISLKTIDLNTLLDDIEVAYTAALLDCNNIKYNSMIRGKVKKATETAILDAIAESTFIEYTNYQKLDGVNKEIADLLLADLNNGADWKTDEGRAAIAEYIYNNISEEGKEAFYAEYKENEYNGQTVLSEVSYAITAVWDDNSTKLRSDYLEPTVNAVVAPFQSDFSERSVKDRLDDLIGAIFPGFGDGDFGDMFGGFADAIKKIGASLSDLLGGLFGGGSDNNTTTTKKPSSSSNGTDSIPKTGDVALYSVAALSVVAGIALVLTKKKKDDK